MPFPTENFALPPREHKKVNYAEFETFSDSSSENNKKQNHGNYISWSSSEDAILTEQVQKYIESQKNTNMNTNDENEPNNLNTNNSIIISKNNENNLNLNKEKNLPENKSEIKLDEKEENRLNLSTENNKNEGKINSLSNINWSKIAEKLENKNARQCQTRWQNILDPNRVKGPWTKEEDNKLIELIKKFGAEKWSYISSHLPGRLGKQCRERWYNHLNPEVRKTGWSKEEEWVLFLLHRKYGNSWSTFSEKIPGRTDNTIKNHWNSIMKKNIVGINNQYQEMIKGKNKKEIEEIENNIMDKCNQKMNKDYNEYYQEKLKNFPMMNIIKNTKKDKDKDKDKNKENENNLNNNDNKSNTISKSNSLENIINNINIKTPTKNKKRIFENIKMSEKSKKKNKKSNSKNEEVKEKKIKQISENKENKKHNSSKKNTKYFNIIDDNELKLKKSGEKILQKDKNILIKEAENKYKEKQKLKKGEKKSKSYSNKHNKKEEENDYNIKKIEKLNAYSNKKTAKKSKRKSYKKRSKKKDKNKFNISKSSNIKEKESPNINNLNNKKININNSNYINSSNMNNYMNNMNNMNNNDFIGNSNINMPYQVYPIEKFCMDEEKDSAKYNFNKILISDSKDINITKKDQQFTMKIPNTGPFYHSNMKNSSESSGGNNSLGKITPDFRINPTAFIPTSTDKYFFTNPQNIPINRVIHFSTNPKINIYPNPGEIHNNNNNKISTDSNSIHSYSFNKSMISANSAFKKSSSGSGSGSGRSFQSRTFNYNNMADLNKQYFSNIPLDENNLNNKM